MNECYYNRRPCTCLDVVVPLAVPLYCQHMQCPSCRRGRRACLAITLALRFGVAAPTRAANMPELAVLTKLAITVITVVFDTCLIAVPQLGGVWLHPASRVMTMMLSDCSIERTGGVIVVQTHTPCTPGGCFCPSSERPSVYAWIHLRPVFLTSLLHALSICSIVYHP